MTDEKTARKTAIVWFRQDLRVDDNPALHHAFDKGYTIIPVFILDDKCAGRWARGAASRWWLHKSLQALNDDLDENIVFRSGNAGQILAELIDQSGAQAVLWNRCYEPWRVKRDKTIKQDLKDKGLEVKTFNASLLWEPWDIKKDDGTPYRVFTPFYRKGCLQAPDPPSPLPAPKRIFFADFTPRYNVYSLNLLPDIQWYRKFESHWSPGEKGAHDRLAGFLDQGLKGYKELRNRPDLDHVSMLSPYLHFGNISPRTVWYAAQKKGLSAGWENDTDHFCSELGWREFSYSLLYHNPHLPTEPLQEKFEDFPWQEADEETLRAWQQGGTGIPLVDAGMRQLWETGWMHNRVRMVVASFLVKNMLLHWHHGEDWFWDTLVDADLANNAASWQWVASCGADAAPYFRIFNPITQGEKFDPDQTYIKCWVPEYGSDAYPGPIVDVKESRARALEAFAELKNSA